MDRRSIDSNVRRSRAIFLSDMHLATPSCRADILLDFLHHHDADTIYLVGDILDFWRVKRRSVWPQSHGDVVRVLLEKARDGARLLFIPGKHDEGLREYCGTRLGGIEVARDCVHTTANGRRLLVVHGNEPQINVRFARWLRFLSDSGRIGLWSLSSHLRGKAKKWLNLISSFEQALAEEARRSSAGTSTMPRTATSAASNI